MGEAEQKIVFVVDGLKSILILVKSNYKDVVEFVCDYQYDPMVKCWPFQLNQVFMNIMVNVCQAIEPKTDPSGSAGQGRLEILTSVQENQLAIRFRDNGCGMTEDVKEKIFEQITARHFFSFSFPSNRDNFNQSKSNQRLDQLGGFGLDAFYLKFDITNILK